MYFVVVDGFMVHILVGFGALWLTIRLLQWYKFFRLDESIIAFFPFSFLVPNLSNN